MKRFNSWLLVVVLLIAVPFWWAMIDNDPGDAAAKPVHIADLRTLAAVIPGPRPDGITASVLATRLVIGDYLASGIGIKRRPLALIAWALPVNGAAPIMIDPGQPFDDQTLAQFPNIDGYKLAQVEAETAVASLVLRTQGRIATLVAPASGVRAPALLGGKAGMVRPIATRGAPKPALPFSYVTAQAVAPGVVVIPTPGIARDAQLIFVTLTDGREFLFTGNIAPLAESWAQLRLRSHLAALRGPARDKSETFAWLRTIQQLHREAPALHIVPGQDYLWLSKQFTSGTITGMQPAKKP